MRFVLALFAFALAALQAATAAAQAPLLYYCDPPRGYYPTVLRCPVPWRLFYPSPSAPAWSAGMQFPPAAKQAGDAAYRNCVAHWTGIPPHAFHGTDYCDDEAQQTAKEAEDAAAPPQPVDTSEYGIQYAKELAAVHAYDREMKRRFDEEYAAANALSARGYEA